MERARRRGDRAARPTWASRTRRRSARRRYTLITFHEMENPTRSRAGWTAAYVMQRCLHCLEPACVSACPTTALYRQPDGPVSYDADKCIGCRYCMLACPWDVPTADWNSLAPKISKCTHCADRADQPVPVAFNGQPLSDDRGQAVRRHHRDSRLRQGVPRRRPALSGPGTRCWRSRTSASPTGPTSTSTTSTEKKKRAGRACCTCRQCRSRNSASRRRGEALSGLHQDGARRRAPRRDGRRRLARRRLCLPEAESSAGDASAVDARTRTTASRRVRASSGTSC